MSKNCIQCLKKTRTGADLLCDDCRGLPSPDQIKMNQNEIPTPSVADIINHITEGKGVYWSNEQVSLICNKALDLEKQLTELRGLTDGLTYKSNQSTKCAGCRIVKHTPLRNDEMGGYVCLTCIDKELAQLQSLIARHNL